MLNQLRTWFRRKYRRHIIGDPPPPYDCLSPTSRALTPLAQHNPAIAAASNAMLSASAITARAIAEGPNAASAMERAQKLIQTTVAELFQSYDISHDQRLVDFIWAQACFCSEKTARDIAQCPKPSRAKEIARELEESIGNGYYDAYLLFLINVVEAFRGVKCQYGPPPELSMDPKKRVAG